MSHRSLRDSPQQERDIEAGIVLRHLLTDGFFPREIPQCFVTRSYGEALTNGGDRRYPQTSLESCEETASVLWRVTTSRELVNYGARWPYPTPLATSRYAREIASYWERLTNLMKRSQISVSRPTLSLDDNADRAMNREFRLSDHPKLRARHRRNAGYLGVRADVQRCYPSVYTHSIAWAVEGQGGGEGQLEEVAYGTREASW